MNRLILLVAQGLGTGLSPKAPGTVGTLLGLPLFILLLLPGNFGFFVGMLVFLAIASVYFCERAEVILNQRDPGSIVIDEIVAVPFCFAGWVSTLYFSSGVMPEWPHFSAAKTKAGPWASYCSSACLTSPSLGQSDQANRCPKAGA